jgi:hypothetical protein
VRTQSPAPRRAAHPGIRLKRLGGLALAVLLPAACASQSPQEKTARLFLDLYLVTADQRAAIQLCTGRARAELQEEIDLLAGLEGRDEAVAQLHPELRLEKIFEQRRPGGDVAFLFRLELKRGELELPSRDVFLLVGAQDGPVRVKRFSFDPSDSHTADMP